MDTGLLIALLNPTIALALGAAFAVLWFHQRHRPYLAVLATSYCLLAPGFLFQYFILPVGLAVTKLVSNLCFAIAACCLSSAIVARYGRRVPYVGIAVMTGGGFAAFLWFMFVQPDLTWRVLGVNFGFGGLSLLVAAELRTVRNNGPTEKILFVLSLLSGLNFIARTLVVVIAHGPFRSYDGFYGSSYWTTALLSQALLSLLIALSLFTAAALDVLRTLKAETYTDPLSGIGWLRCRPFRVVGPGRRLQPPSLPASSSRRGRFTPRAVPEASREWIVTPPAGAEPPPAIGTPPDGCPSGMRSSEDKRGGRHRG